MNALIRIKGEVTPETYSGFRDDLAEMNLQNGDVLQVYIDSEGGCLPSAMLMAEELEKLRRNGVYVETIAQGMVASAAVIPYLESDKKILDVSKSPQIMVHGVAVPTDQVKLGDLEDIKDGLVRFSEDIMNFYKSRGVADGVADLILSDGDHVFTDPEQIKALGLADEVIGKPARWEQFFNFARKKEQKTTYDKKVLQIYLNKMDNTPVIKADNSDAMADQTPVMEDKTPTMMGQTVEELSAELERAKAMIADLSASIEAMKNADPLGSINGDLTYEQSLDALSEEGVKNFLQNFTLETSRKGGEVTNTVCVKNSGKPIMRALNGFKNFEVVEEEKDDKMDVVTASKNAIKNATNTSHVPAPTNRFAPKSAGSLHMPHLTDAQMLHMYKKGTFGVSEDDMKKRNLLNKI